MFKSLLVAFVLCFAVLEPAHADTLYNNLGNTPGTVLGVFPIGNPPVGSGPEGDSFSTGVSAFLLTDVQLALTGFQDSNSFSVSVFSDNGTACTAGPTCSGGPLALLYTIATVSDNSLSTSLADHNFSLAAPQTLAANTRYWIIASSANGSGTLWSYTEDLSGIGVAGEFNYDHAGFGGTPALLPNSTETGCFVGGANQCTPFQMAVTGTAVPEPSSLLLLVTGILGLMAITTCRRKRLA
jgi:hypothetical protein